jgi:hypothetical protein
MLREVAPQRLVDRRGVAEYLSHIGVKENDVRSLLVPLVVLATNATAQVVLWPHVVVRHWVIWVLVHILGVLSRSPRGH